MAAAVASTAVETISTVPAMIGTTTVPTAITIATVPVVAASVVAMSVITATIKATAIVATPVEAGAVVAAVIPRARANEDAADEVVRPVIAVWSAGVRIVAVVAVGADRRRAVDGAHSNGYANLRVGIARGKKQNSQQCHVF